MTTLVPHRRTWIVLFSLVGAMTLASGLLLMLEPSGSKHLAVGVPLQQVHSTISEEHRLFKTDPPLDRDRWRSIVIHDSGSLVGSAATLDRAHLRIGRDGLGYHFVINNGSGGTDGLIERGPRWRYQADGAHSVGAEGDWLNRHAVGVCLISDLQRRAPTEAQLARLVWLIQSLQRRIGIPAERVHLPSDLDRAVRASGLFPAERLRAQLLNLHP